MDPVLLEESFYSFVICNYPELTVRINRVEPEHFQEDIFSSENTEWPGEELFNGIIQTDCQLNEPKEIRLALKKYLNNSSGTGQLFIFIEPTESARNQFENDCWNDRPCISVWLQLTRLAVDVFAALGNFYDSNKRIINFNFRSETNVDGFGN